MAVSDQTLPPIGFVNFCAVNGDECKRPNPVSLPMRMTNKRWLQLVDVNEAYNRAIEPVTDLEQYKVAEYWTYPGTRGDCEDYVLAKKRRLIELGWPPSALLITVARDQNGDGHAVLTAATDIGDFILDNQSDEILPWKDTPYAYVKRQSQSHPYIWVSLDGKGQTRSASIVDVLGLRR